jgi:hypothetical protein
MTENRANSRNEGEAQLAAHEDFLELCAVATSDSLTEGEWDKLKRHLATCDACSSVLRDYQRITEEGMGTLAPEFAAESIRAVSSHSIESTKRKLFSRISLDLEERGRGAEAVVDHRSGAKGNGHPRRTSRATQCMLRYAAAIALVFGLTATAYRLGERKNAGLKAPVESATSKEDGILKKEVAILTQGHEALVAQLHGREQDLESLKIMLGQKSDEILNLKQQQQSLEDVALKAGDERTAIASERDAINQQLATSQANVSTIRGQLNALQQLRSGDLGRAASLEAQIAELSDRLKDNGETIDQQQQLLASDRDIRDLMGARDLYIAEVYDVDRDGQTRRPFGRVFFTKDKSLIFYAYDLQRQPGVTDANTFQAWGQRGLTRAGAVNLGIFYQDNAANRRWVLKVDDPKTLRQIDAVFVTVEPNGGSPKPSGKQLLFAYLRVDPNHP